MDKTKNYMCIMHLYRAVTNTVAKVDEVAHETIMTSSITYTHDTTFLHLNRIQRVRGDVAAATGIP